MKLLNPIDTPERRLSAAVLERHPAEGAIYGCGSAPLFDAYPALIEAHQAGKLLGVAGLALNEEMISRYPADVRGHAGAILALAPQIFVADALSQEWAAHLAIRVRSGCSLAWGATVEEARIEEPPWMSGGAPLVARDVGEAIAAAILGIPCTLLCTEDWGSHHNRAYHPLMRWASEAGVAENVIWSVNEAFKRKPDSLRSVPRAYVEARRQQVADILEQLATRKDPLAVTIQQAPPGAGRVLELGCPFDEQLHYTEDYFGGKRGVHFTRPDGAIDVYHSTALAWGGFYPIAAWLRDLGMPGPKLLDLGCAAGGFVQPALDVGFDATGVDISEDAIRIGHEDVQLRARLQVGDITKALPSGPFDVITAFDLLEHIFLPDVRPLLERIAAALRPGGIGAFNICTRGEGEGDYTFKRGEIVTPENSWLLVAGHVTIRRWAWWCDQVLEAGLTPRHDLAQRFQVRRAEDNSLNRADSWSARNVLFVERAS